MSRGENESNTGNAGDAGAGSNGERDSTRAQPDPSSTPGALSGKVLLGVVAVAVVTLLVNGVGGVVEDSVQNLGPPLDVVVTETGDDCGGYVLPLDPAKGLPPVPSVESAERADWALARGGVRLSPLVEVSVQGKFEAAVTLTGLDITVVERRPAMRGIALRETCGDAFWARWMVLDLDRRPPAVTASYDEPEPPDAGPAPKERPITFPYKVTSGEPELFYLDARTEKCHCSWTATLRWIAGDEVGATRLDNKGKPFDITTAAAARPYTAYNGGVPVPVDPITGGPVIKR